MRDPEADNHELDDSLIEFVRQSLPDRGSFTSEWHGWNHGESRVWRLTFEHSPRDDRAFLKSYRQPGKFDRERIALQTQATQLPFTTPQVIATTDPPHPAILMTAVPGTIVQDQPLTPAAEATIHETAGRFLAAMHDLPFEDTDIAFVEAFEQRAETWLARAIPYVEQPLIARTRTRITETLPLLKDAKRVPCHRDFSPRNWLADEQGNVAFIDFEHSRPDFYLLDFERIWSRVWPERPDLEAAFWQGYGRVLSGGERDVLERCATLSALSTIVWSCEHGDAGFEAHGRWMLARLTTGSRSGQKSK